MSQRSVAKNPALKGMRSCPSLCLAASAFLFAGCDGNALSSTSTADSEAPNPGETDAAALGQGQADAANASDSLPDAAGQTQTVSDYGQLGGALSGYAWVAGGTGTTWISPNPCNDQGCFTNTGGVLCAQGSIAALTCTSDSACDWDTNWGAMIGWNPTPVQHEAWGAAAMAGIAVTYTGGAGEYRLMTHVAGDPDSKVYCVERYVSGSLAVPSQFLSQCWNNSGDVLPSFAVVDTLGLQLISAKAPIDFDICISAITLF